MKFYKTEKFTIPLLTLLCVGILAQGCSKEEEEPMYDANNVVDAAVVEQNVVRSPRDAVDFAKKAINSLAANSKVEGIQRLQAKGTYTVTAYNHGHRTEQADTNSIYVVNFSNGGFSLVPADSRIDYVYGVSDTDNFEVNEDDENDIGVFLLTSSGISIDGPAPDSLWRPPFQPHDPTTPFFEEFEGQQCYCYITNDTVHGPEHILWIHWDQEYPYNICTPLLTYDDNPHNHIRVGCVPVAMGQIIALWQRPYSYAGHNYNWSTILTSLSYTDHLETGAYETAEFLNDVAEACHVTRYYNINMAGANLSDAMDGFRALGYDAVMSGGYDFYTIMADLNTNHPVFVGGFPASGYGHAWIIDGYYRCRTVRRYVSVATHATLATFYDYVDYVHCNFGWGGSCNGFYLSGVFNTPSGNFNQGLEIIHNIRYHY